MSDDSSRSASWRELTAVLLLSITAILTAWSGFQASKWGGAMSISFSKASSARIEAARLDGVANRKMSVQVGLFIQWLDARAEKSSELADYLVERFPEPMASAFTAWQATDPEANPGAPETPFDMPEYQLPEQAAAQAADDRADAHFQDALTNNQRGDNYTILTVLFATVLFFTALSGRMRSERGQWALLGVAFVGFVVGAAILISFPRLI